MGIDKNLCVSSDRSGGNPAGLSCGRRNSLKLKCFPKTICTLIMTSLCNNECFEGVESILKSGQRGVKEKEV